MFAERESEEGERKIHASASAGRSTLQPSRRSPRCVGIILPKTRSASWFLCDAVFCCLGHRLRLQRNESQENLSRHHPGRYLLNFLWCARFVSGKDKLRDRQVGKRRPAPNQSSFITGRRRTAGKFQSCSKSAACPIWCVRSIFRRESNSRRSSWRSRQTIACRPSSTPAVQADGRFLCSSPAPSCNISVVRPANSIRMKREHVLPSMSGCSGR